MPGHGSVEAAWWGPRPAAAPTLVLLHEGLGSVGLWRRFPARLAGRTGCGVFAWSRFSYGRSDPAPLPWPLDYMHREAQDVLPSVLEAACVRSCVLVGHSDGASIATICAGSRSDERLRGLVLLAPHFFVEDGSLVSIEQARRNFQQGGLRARLARHHADPDMAFNGWSGAWLDPRFRASFDLSPELSRIDVPMLMLILQGTRDPYGTEAQPRLAERMAGGLVETVLLDAAHAPHLEAEAATLHAVTGFVRRCFRAGVDAVDAGAR